MILPRRPFFSGLIALLAVLAADQLSKNWLLFTYHLAARGTVAILPVLNLTLVWNHGITFGLLNGFGAADPFLLGWGALTIVILLLVWMWRADTLATTLSVGGIAGGAIGNIIDRLRFGAVVDFIHAHAWGWSWYVFNVADAAICVGVTVLMLEGLRPRTL